jgi:hypothetical protein
MNYMIYELSINKVRGITNTCGSYVVYTRLLTTETVQFFEDKYSYRAKTKQNANMIFQRSS